MNGSFQYREGEDFESRHHRRLTQALKHQYCVRHYCKDMGLRLEIKDRKRWAVYLGDRVLLKWWPEKARIEVNGRYAREHVVDVNELCGLMTKLWGPRLERLDGKMPSR